MSDLYSSTRHLSGHLTMLIGNILQIESEQRRFTTRPVVDLLGGLAHLWKYLILLWQAYKIIEDVTVEPPLSV